jgi:hypothetical protein
MPTGAVGGAGIDTIGGVETAAAAGSAANWDLPQEVQNFAPGRLSGAPQWMHVVDNFTSSYAIMKRRATLILA